MTAFDFLLSLESRGVKLKPSQGKLMVDAPAGVLTNQDRTMLARYKADLLALLTIAVIPSDLPLEWRERWEERAAIIEHEGGLPFEQANTLALAEIINQMGQTGGSRADNSLRALSAGPSDKFRCPCQKEVRIGRAGNNGAEKPISTLTQGGESTLLS